MAETRLPGFRLRSAADAAATQQLASELGRIREALAGWLGGNVRPLPARLPDLPVLLFMDPPDHTRLRRLVSYAFTPRTMERLRGHVADLADELLRDVDPSGFELIESLAYPLPVTVICGVSPSRAPYLMALSRRLVSAWYWWPTTRWQCCQPAASR